MVDCANEQVTSNNFCSKFQNRISDPKKSLTMRLSRQDIFSLPCFLVSSTSPIITVRIIRSICLALHGQSSIDCMFWHNGQWPSCRSVRVRPFLSIFNEATLLKNFLNVNAEKTASNTYDSLGYPSSSITTNTDLLEWNENIVYYKCFCLLYLLTQE